MVFLEWLVNLGLGVSVNGTAYVTGGVNLDGPVDPREPGLELRVHAIDTDGDELWQWQGQPSNLAPNDTRVAVDTGGRIFVSWLQDDFVAGRTMVLNRFSAGAPYPRGVLAHYEELEFVAVPRRPLTSTSTPSPSAISAKLSHPIPMKSARAVVLVVLVVLVPAPGCYLAHEDAGDGGAEPPREDARPRPDTSRAPPPPDGGTPRDTAPPTEEDVGPPLSAEPDPDLGPDARPSDYPDAEDWDDPPDVAAGDPCCVVGELIEVTSRDLGRPLAHQAPRIAWGAGRWGLLALQQSRAPDFEYEPRAIVFELDPDGRPLGEPRELRSATGVGDILWAEGRWAVAVMDEPGPGGYARLFDRDFRPASAWLPLGPSVRISLARLTSGDLYVAVQDQGAAQVVTSFDDFGTEVTSRFAADSTRTLNAAGLRSRVAVLHGRHTTPSGDGSNDIVALGGPPDHAVLGRSTLDSWYLESAGIAPLRDLVVVAGIEDDQAEAQVFDPFEMRAVAPARHLGPVDLSGGGGAVGVAASSKLGVGGVCYVVTDGASERTGELRIDFQLIDPSGDLVGEGVTAFDGRFRGAIANCNVGSDDRGFLVALWDGSSLWVRRISVARR